MYSLNSRPVQKRNDRWKRMSSPRPDRASAVCKISVATLIILSTKSTLPPGPVRFRTAGFDIETCPRINCKACWWRKAHLTEWAQIPLDFGCVNDNLLFLVFEPNPFLPILMAFSTTFSLSNSFFLCVQHTGKVILCCPDHSTIRSCA